MHIIVRSRLHLSTSLEKDTHRSHVMRVFRAVSFHINYYFGHFIVLLFKNGLVLKVFLFDFLLAYLFV